MRPVLLYFFKTSNDLTKTYGIYLVTSKNNNLKTLKETQKIKQKNGNNPVSLK